MAWDADSILEVKVGYVANGQQCFNVLHYEPTGNSAGFTIPELTEGFLNANAGDANGEFVGEWKKLLSEEVVINQVTAQQVYPTRYGVKKLEFTVNGTRVGACSAQNVQGCITKKGDLGNRHNVGSIHIGGMPDSAYGAGELTLVTQGLFQDLIDNLLLGPLGDGLTAVEYLPSILNKTPVIVDGKEKFVISGSTVITSWDVQTTLRTQRNRTKGIGI